MNSDEKDLGPPRLGEVPIRGCSLAYEVHLRHPQPRHLWNPLELRLRSYGYDLVAFGGHDAVFVHESARDSGALKATELR